MDVLSWMGMMTMGVTEAVVDVAVELGDVLEEEEEDVLLEVEVGVEMLTTVVAAVEMLKMVVGSIETLTMVVLRTGVLLVVVDVLVS